MRNTEGLERDQALYTRIKETLRRIHYKHMVAGKVVSDAGEGLIVEITLTAGELESILTQRANNLANKWRHQTCQGNTHYSR